MLVKRVASAGFGNGAMCFHLDLKNQPYQACNVRDRKFGKFAFVIVTVKTLGGIGLLGSSAMSSSLKVRVSTLCSTRLIVADGEKNLKRMRSSH
jgi:hypothetical protein